MDTHVNYTIVGIFVISLLAAIIFSIIWLSSGFSSTSSRTYKIYMKESVAGLNVDSVVEFNGVTVGSVKKVEIDLKDPRLVILLINVDQTTPITNGTRATLNSKGLTGIAYLALVDEGKDRSPIQIEAGEHYPLIKTSPSFFWRLDTGMKKLSENLGQVTHALEGLLDAENLLSFKTILVDLRHITGVLASNTDKINTLIQNSAQASTTFLPLLHNSQQLLQTLNSQVLPAANKAMLNLDQITTNLSSVAHELKENPAVLIRGKTPQPLGPGEK